MSEPSATEAAIVIWGFIILFGIALALSFWRSR